MAKLTSRPALPALAAGDKLHVVDVSDTTDDPLGTSKFGTAQQIKDFVGAGVTTFQALTDTPANFTSASLKVVRVNAGETALEFVTASSGGHVIQEEGTPLTARTNLNFIGANVTATDNAGNDATDITITGGGSAHTIQDEGTPLTARTNLNFIGSAVTVTDNGGADASDVTISALAATDIDTLAELNAIVTDATLIDTGDSRLSDARTPTGAAGGDLTGTYPSPTVGANKVTYAKFQKVAANNVILGNDNGTTQDVQELAAADVVAIIKTNLPTQIGIDVTDEFTALTTGTAIRTFRMPYAMTLTDVRASLTTAPTGADVVVDINEGGVTILSTKLSIDDGEKTSTTATTPAVISDAALADDAEITIDIDQVGSVSTEGAGLKIWLIGTFA